MYFYLRIKSSRGRKYQNIAKSPVTERLNGERKYTLKKSVFTLCIFLICLGKTTYLRISYENEISGRFRLGCCFRFNERKCNVCMSLYYFLSSSAKNSSSLKWNLSYSFEAGVTQVPALKRDLLNSDKIT